jgi:diguanylate cyclase (GGDEF)-like protein
MRTRTPQSPLRSPSPTGAMTAAGGSLNAAARPMLLRALARRVTDGRPAIAWSLALLFLSKALVSAAVVMFPISGHQPTLAIGIGCAVAIAGAAIVWLAANRIPLLGFELITATGTLATSVLITRASSHGGMMLAAFQYPWTAIYAAHFFPRRAVNVQALLISVGFGAGLLFGQLSHTVIYWVVVTITIWSISVLLGNLSESVRRQVGTDYLTGLLNRSGFLVAALRERALANRTGTPLTVAVIDLDDFKQINDGAGHAAGDQLLVALAQQWRERLRPSDILGRHGGDEFVVLLPCTSAAGADAALKRLRSGEDPVSWSIGISEWLAGEDLEAPLARADKQLYDAKVGAGEVRRREVVGETGLGGVLPAAG